MPEISDNGEVVIDFPEHLTIKTILNPMTAKEIQSRLKKLGSPAKARELRRFFKTGKGQYGEGDIFLGVTVPVQRKLAREFSGLPMREVSKLLKSVIHEERLTALLILVDRFRKADVPGREKMYNFYMKNIRYVNNWDLVDLSSHCIIGAHLYDGDRSPIYELARSDNIWERRAAIVSTFYFIAKGDLTDTFRISRMLLKDEQDLIHKAVGWMLREAGKRDTARLEEFLIKHYKTMPRTMLRYSIEKFSEEKRQAYLKGRADLYEQ